MESRRSSGSWVFKETEYLLSSCVSGEWLEVTAEETLSSHTWKGKFDAKHIEELTRKTGNFKQFLVFTTMLESAINKSSESVTLDLLTYADLEALRERRNTMVTTTAGHGGGGVAGQQRATTRPPPAQQPETLPGKRYLILTYSVEFDRIHYPLALSYGGQADSSHLRNTVARLTTELEKYKRQGKKSSALARLQKDYDDLLRVKEELEEAVETLQTQLAAVDRRGGGQQEKKQLKMLHEVIRNLEEEVLQERTKHQRYVSRKIEELRALTQELGELRSSERTLRSRVKNLTNELALLRKGMRSSPSGYLRPRNTPPSSSSSVFKKTPSSSSSVFKKTPSSSTAGSGSRHRHKQRTSSSSKNCGSLERERKGSSGSLERKRKTSSGLERKRKTSSGSLERKRKTSSGSLERKRKTSSGSLERKRKTSSGSLERKRKTSSGSLERKRKTSSGSLERKRGSGSNERRQRSGSSGRRESGSLERGREGSLGRRGGSGSLERGRSGSQERRLALGVSNSRLRSPSPRGVGGGHWMRFDPSAYVEDKRRQQKENQERFQRFRSPSYHSTGSVSRSSSLEKPLSLHRRRSGSGGRPPLGALRAGSRRLWGSSEGLRCARTRSSSLGSLSGRSSRDSSPASLSSHGPYHHRRRPSLSDVEPSPPPTGRGRPRNSKKGTSSSGKQRTSTPTTTSAGKPGGNRNNSGSLLDHSAEMSEIDARLNALQQFMKRSLEATKSNATRR